MRRSLVIGICCAAVGLVFPAVSQTAAGKPTLRLVDASPLVVRGAHFAPAERVSVTLIVRGTYRKSVSARANGAFVVSFPGARIPYCAAYGVTAVGNRGSRAAFHVVGECPQDPAPLYPLDPIPGKRKG